MTVETFTGAEIEAYNLVNKGKLIISTTENTLRRDVDAAVDQVVALADRIKAQRSDSR